jgi:hypothetical protein
MYVYNEYIGILMIGSTMVSMKYGNKEQFTF